jgi:hypothetical protein
MNNRLTSGETFVGAFAKVVPLCLLPLPPLSDCVGHEGDEYSRKRAYLCRMSPSSTRDDAIKAIVTR